LLAKQRKDHGENDRVGQSRWNTGLSGSEKTTCTLWDGQQHTRAQHKEERRRDQQIRLREDETQRLGDETVHEEEHEGVEHDGTLTRVSVHDTNVSARCREKYTWAESQKKSSWDGNLLGGNIGEHC